MAEKFRSTTELGRYLQKYGIDPTAFESNNGKGIGSLLEEIRSGESVLSVSRWGLVRDVAVAGVNVMYEDQILYEDRQELADGRVVRRESLPYSITEKHQGFETPIETAIRGLQEELGIVGVSLLGLGSREEEKDSLAYPGLPARYTYHEFKTVLNDSQYNPNGYTEVTPKKTTHFLWRL